MNTTDTTEKETIRMPQAEMPRAFLKDALTLAGSLRDDFAGKDASPIDLAQSLSRSPSSSTWRFLTGAAVAYGLTSGAYNAPRISLTPLGEKIVSPTEEGAGQEGLLEALLKPSIPRNFYEKYNGAKFPQEDIAKNVLRSLGVPQDRTSEALRIIVENAKFLGVMTHVGGNQYIQLRPSVIAQPRSMTEKTSPVLPINEVQNGTRRPQISPTSDGLYPIVVEKGYFVISISQELKDRALFEDKVGNDLRAILQAAKKFVNDNVQEKPKNETLTSEDAKSSTP